MEWKRRGGKGEEGKVKGGRKVEEKGKRGGRRHACVIAVDCF